MRTPAGQQKTAIIVIVPRSCAGSQTPRSPPHPVPRRVHPSTPSRRWVRTHTPRHGMGGAGGFAGRETRLSYLNLHGERCKMQGVARKKKTDNNAPPLTREPRGKHGENTARGTHQPREKKRQQGGGKGKRGKGNPTNQERNRTTRRRKKRTSKTLRNRLGEAPCSAPPA